MKNVYQQFFLIMSVKFLVLRIILPNFQIKTIIGYRYFHTGVIVEKYTTERDSYSSSL